MWGDVMVWGQIIIRMYEAFVLAGAGPQVEEEIVEYSERCKGDVVRAGDGGRLCEVM